MTTTLRLMVVAVCWSALANAGEPSLVSPVPLGSSLPGLSPAQQVLFTSGKATFEHTFTVPEGLGPQFNQAACVTCHVSPVTGGADNGTTNNVTHYNLFNNGNVYAALEFGGPVLQKQSITGMPGAGSCSLTPDTVPPIPQIRTSHRNTPPVFGFGLLDAVPDAEILEYLGPQPFKDPSVLGMANYQVELQTTVRFLGFALDVNRTQPAGPTRVGRFGWKAQTGTLFQFSNEPFNIELGMTSPYFKRENSPTGAPIPPECLVATSQPNDTGSLNSLALFQFQALLAPPPPKPLTPTALYGGVLFVTSGCADCHRPALKTGDQYWMPLSDGTVQRVPALENKVIFPYSDLLIHDMGPGLEDGRVMGLASTRFWRSTPLWGIRFKKQYLHDGSSTTEDDAIRRHGGEGAVSAARYAGLNAHQQAALIEFLESL